MRTSWMVLCGVSLACSGELGGEKSGAPKDDVGAPGARSAEPGAPTPARTPGADDAPNGGPEAPGEPGSPGASAGPNDTPGPEGPEAPGSNAPGTTPSDPDAPVTCSDDILELGSAPLRRLSSTEYLNTLADLFPGIQPELPVLPVEAPVDSFDNDARALGPSDVSISRWEEIAFRYTSALCDDPELLSAALPCAAEVDDEDSARACGADFVASFGTKTHRRPLSDEETARYRALFDAQLASIDFEGAVQLTAMAMLQSPWFLYRIEASDGGNTDGAVPLDSWQIASRLSYLLWQSLPDRALFDAAAAGELTDPAEIENQVRRMLNEPRARTALGDFYRQWLYFDRIDAEEHGSRVPELFPNWTPETQASAREELLRFAERATFEGAGTLSELLLSRETDVNGPLAEIYGVDAPDEGEWHTVTLPEGERAGILTRIGFLAAHAHSANGSPPLRGNYVMQRLFCLELPPPPADADTSPPNAEGTPLTNRELFEERTAPDSCQACHTVLDSFGFGFENYDAVGAYRVEDNGQPVDAVVTLVGTDLSGDVDGAIELSERLVESEQVQSCAVSRWYRYAVGRGVEARDACALEPLNQRFQDSEGSFIDLLVAIATSPEFRHRPSDEVETQ